MAAYRRVYDSRYLRADCKEPASAPKPYARQSNMGYLYLLPYIYHKNVASLSQDQLTVVTGNVLRFLLGNYADIVSIQSS